MIRCAYGSSDLAAIRVFYGGALGLVEIKSFLDHNGFDGVVFQLRNSAHELEFTVSRRSKTPATDAETLLAFYPPDEAECAEFIARLDALPSQRTTSTNPYWNQVGTVFTDPDGRHVVIVSPSSVK